VPKAFDAGAPRAKLDRDELVATVLRLTREVGLDGLTMRGLAHELGVTPMAAYHWIPSKQALIDLALESVLAELATIEHTGDWVEQLRSRAISYRDTVARYPGVGAALINHPVSKLTRDSIAEGLEILRGAGFVEPELGYAWGTYQSFMLGHHSLEEQRNRRGAPRKRDEISRLRYEGAGPDAFDWGLDVVLAALKSAAPRP
jgi:AcrR family transcriptional regulator